MITSSLGEQSLARRVKPTMSAYRMLTENKGKTKRDNLNVTNYIQFSLSFIFMDSYYVSLLLSAFVSVYMSFSSHSYSLCSYLSAHLFVQYLSSSPCVFKLFCLCLHAVSHLCVLSELI